MAKFSVRGLNELSLAVHEAGEIPDEVKTNIATSACEVLAQGQREYAKSYGVYDPESNVHIADKIKVSKPKVKNEKITAYVTFSGTRKRGENKTKTRNAEIAFINEFGKPGQPARPFIESSNKKHADEAVEAAEKVFFDWQESKFTE